jgi:hypothetical protein
MILITFQKDIRKILYIRLLNIQYALFFNILTYITD